MKPHLDIRHQGTLGDEGRTRMTFDENSVAHLMRIMTDLYSDPEKAVIREYASNAMDSHIAAGQTRPVEISLPSALVPSFSVKDYGTGLSRWEVEQHLSKYGWSSKRDTDSQVGMLGLGFKCALTYSSQFTCIAIKNGMMTTVLITRDEEGAGAVQVLDESPTDEPNGVEIEVPVRYVAGFNAKVRDHFRSWESGTVLLNGEPNVSYWDDPNSLVIDPDIVIVKGISRDILVMGGVPYPLDYEHKISENDHARALVFRVGIGDVDIVPSREALHYTKLTLQTIELARDYVQTAYQRSVQDRINRAESHGEAMKMLAEARRYRFWKGNLQSMFYKGDRVPSSIAVHSDTTIKWEHGGGYNASKGYTTLQAEAVDDLHIVGHHGRSLDANTKTRISIWLQDNYSEDDPAPKKIWLYPHSVGAPWFSEIDYEKEIKPIELDSKINTEIKPANSWRHYVYYNRYVRNTHRSEKGWTLEWTDAHAGCTPLYVHANEMPREDVVEILQLLQKVLLSGSDPLRIYCIPQRQESKFKKGVSGAKHVLQYAKEIVDGYSDDVSDEWKDMAVKYDVRQSLTALNRMMIERDLRHQGRRGKLLQKSCVYLLRDPELKRLLNLAREVDNKQDGFNTRRSAVLSLRRIVYPGQDAVEGEKSKRCQSLVDIQRHYPLLFSSNGLSSAYGKEGMAKAAIIEYCNAMYLLRQELHLTHLC